MIDQSANEELVRIKQEQSELDRIRRELADRCGQLDVRHWIKRNFLMGIADINVNSQDPALQMTSHWVGGTGEVYLTRNGRMFMGLQHNNSEEGDDRVYFPEILREATLDEYRTYSSYAMDKLELIEGASLSRYFIESEPDVYDIGSFVTIRPLVHKP